MTDQRHPAENNERLFRLVTTSPSPEAAQGLPSVLLTDLDRILPTDHLRALLLDIPPTSLEPYLAQIRDRLQGDLLFIRTDDEVPGAMRQEYGVSQVFPVAMPLEWIIPVMRDALAHEMPPVIQNFALKLARDAGRSLHYDETIDKALLGLQTMVPYVGANVMLFEEGHAAVKYHRGYPDDSRILLDHTRVPLSLPNFQRVLVTGEPLLIPDVRDSAYWELIQDHAWIRSWMGVPIKKNNVVIGMINFDGDTVGCFQPYHRDLVMQVIDHVSLLVETYQLYDTLNEYTVLLSVMNRQNALLFTPLSSYNSLNEMCRHIAEIVVSTFGQTDCGVMLVDEEGTTLKRYARAGEFHVRATGDIPLSGPGLVAHAAHNRERVYAPDVTQHPNYAANEPETRSELVLPLVVNDALLGVLDLQSNEFNAFSVRDQEGLWAFAQYAALAIQNLLVVNTQRDLAREMEMYVQERTRDLEISQRRVEAILNHAQDPILLLSANGNISQGNAAFERTLGLDEIDYYAADLREIIEVGVDQFDDALERALSTQKSQRFEAQLRTRRADQERIQTEITLAPVANIQREEEAFVCTIRDVTQYLEVQQTLRRSLEREQELSQMKSDFIRTVHHQFNTPLSVIMSSVGILKMGLDQLVDDEGQPYQRLDKHFTRINNEIRQLARMLEETKLVGDTQRFNPNILDITREVDRAIQVIRRDYTEPHIIKIQTQGVAPFIMADTTHLQKAVYHLLSNAMKFSPDDSEILIELDLTNDENVVLHVVDHGMGIPAHELSSVFQPFFKGEGAATSRGVGLGLTVIKQTAELHRGQVTVTSDPGIETRFTLVLPRRLES